jgi:hypothetical protein
MKRRYMLTALAGTLLCAPASAAESKMLAEVLAPLSEGACVRLEAVRAVSATVQLTPDQFQFVRAFWMAIPPASRELPPGDKAFLARDSEGTDVLGLYDDGGQVCVVLKATDWLERLVDQVGRGETGQRGQAM